MAQRMSLNKDMVSDELLKMETDFVLMPADDLVRSGSRKAN